MESDRDRAAAYHRAAFHLPDGVTVPTFFDIDAEGHLQAFRSRASVRVGTDTRKAPKLVQRRFHPTLSAEKAPETLEPTARENGTIGRDLTGKSFADLTPFRREGSGWSCRCRRAGCDRTIVVSRADLLSGTVVNCGEHCGVLA